MENGLWICILILSDLLLSTEAGPCNFGEGCLHPCRCAGATVCDPETGQCPGDCSPGWSGPYCRIGANVALGRQVTESKHPFIKAASLAVDGQRHEGGCTTIQEKPAWWRVHLGGLYRITRVVLFLGANEKGKSLDVLVSKDGDSDPVTCTRYTAERSLNPDREGVVMFQCPSHVIGTSFILYRATPPLELCEVQITAEIAIETNVIETTVAFTTTGACDVICEGNITDYTKVPEECRVQCGLSEGASSERGWGIISPVSIAFIVTTCILSAVVLGLLFHIHTLKKSAKIAGIEMSVSRQPIPHDYEDPNNKRTTKKGSRKMSKKRSAIQTGNKYGPGLSLGVAAVGTSAASPSAVEGVPPEVHYDDPNTLQGTSPEANYDNIDDLEGPMSIDIGEVPSSMYDAVDNMAAIVRPVPYTSLPRKGVK